jgi:hypothetical protein
VVLAGAGEGGAVPFEDRGLLGMGVAVLIEVTPPFFEKVISWSVSLLPGVVARGGRCCFLLLVPG